MATRCKFVCTEMVQNIDGYTYKFEPVISGSPENEEFFKFTPHGELTIGVVESRRFEPGKEYYLDLHEAGASEE